MAGALQAAQAADATRLSICRGNVLEWLQSAFLMAREKSDPAAMVSAAREIGKMMGFYAVETKRIELTAGKDGEQARMENMSDAELLVLIGSRPAVV